MADRDFIALVADMVKECENYRDTLSADRIKANEYYDGVMVDTPSDKGRSSVVSRDVRETVQKVLPSLTRVFLSSDQLVEFKPGGMGDEEGAEQATDYINHVVLPECDGETVITDAIHDALKLRNAVLTWWFDEKTTVTVSKHTGLDENAFAILVNEEGVEVLEHTERQEAIDTPQGKVMAPVHDLKIRRRVTKGKPNMQCLPLEEFLIHPDALSEDTSPIIGRKTRMRRTELVAMGYDKEVVAKLPINGADGKMEEAEIITRRQLMEGGRNELTPELQEVDYYEVYVRIDLDDDGIAELRRMCFGGAVTTNGLLMNEEADDVPYSICAVKRRPHQWEGVSIADDVMDLQRVNTVLVRQTLDNLYWQNNPQIAMPRDAVENPDAVTNPQFGQTIWLKDGMTAAQAVQPVVIPFVAAQSFQMLEYNDRKIQERTGVSDASGGLPPDALQNVTAKASAMAEQQGIGQADLMAKTFARGLERAFKGLLRITIKHQDKPRVVRLRDEWVTFDPRQWNAEMDCSVNTGLGAGTRERDMQTLQGVLSLQERVAAALGPQNPFVTPENLGNTLFKLAEAAGLKSPRLYFTKPKPEEMAALKQAMANKPDPEAEKAKAQMQADMAMKKMDMEAAAYKERVQGEAAVAEARERALIESEDKNAERDLKKYEIDQKLAFEREKLAREEAMQMAPLGLEMGADGKPIDRANNQLQGLVGLLMDRIEAGLQASNRPRRVRTPDGEEFVLESFDPMVVN